MRWTYIKGSHVQHRLKYMVCRTHDVGKLRTTHILESGAPEPSFSHSASVAVCNTFALLSQVTQSPSAHAPYTFITPLPSQSALYLLCPHSEAAFVYSPTTSPTNLLGEVCCMVCLCGIPWPSQCPKDINKEINKKPSITLALNLQDILVPVHLHSGV